MRFIGQRWTRYTLDRNFPFFLVRYVESTGSRLSVQKEKKCITQSSCIQQHNKIRVIIHLKTRNVPRKFSVILYAKIQIIKRVSNCLMVKYITKSGKLRMTTHDFPLYGTAPLFHYKFVKGTTH